MSGPATEKARLPNCVLLRLTAAARVVEERSWRTFESAEANTIRLNNIVTLKSGLQVTQGD